MGRWIIFKIFLFIVYFSLPAVVVYPQVNLNNVTKEIDRSPRKKVEEELKVEPKAPVIEKEKKKHFEGKRFFVKKIQLTGCKTFSPDDFKDIVARYENREVTIGELNALAKDIEREYLRKGVIAACIVPPQEIKDGVVVLQVIEAKMGELKIKPHKYFKKQRLIYYWSIEPNEVLQYDKMSRSLQLMNKNPDRNVRAMLHAGKKPHTTDVILDVNTHFPLHVTSTFDREGSVFTGKRRQTFGLRHNNFLGYDDILLSGYTFGDDFSGVYVFHSVPVTNFGTSLMYGYSYSKSFPKKEYEVYGIDARAKNISFFVYQDLFKKGKYYGDVHFGINANDKTTKMNTGTINRDRLRVLVMGGTFIYRQPGNVTYIRPELSQGINLFGARRKSDFSSRGAKNTFTKFNLGIEHRRILYGSIEGRVKLATQLSSTKLTPQEEFYLGGIDSVRGYPSGDFLADTSFQVNIEILTPPFFIPATIKLPYMRYHLKKYITPVIFFDYGWGEKRGPQAGEKKSANLAGAGLGIRIRLFKWGILRLEWGFPVGDKPITESSHSRFHMAVDFQS